MAQFIQICASQDDVFALDDRGDVYRYNFDVKAWALDFVVLHDICEIEVI